jgi:peptidyl-Lys metalloendopeptidase
MQSGWIVAFITTVFMVAHGHAALSLEAILVSKRSSYSADQRVQVALTFKNTGSTPISIYSWCVNKPKLMARYFQVTRSGNPVAHVGALYKVSSAVLAETTSLDPGTGKSIVIGLSATYDMTEGGKYTAQFSASASLIISGSADTSDSSLESNTVSFTTAGHPNQVLIESDKYVSEVKASTYTYVGCSPTRTNDVKYGVAAAKTYATSASTYVNKLTSTVSIRYTTWFGKYSAANLALIKKHFTNIAAVFTSKPMTFDCSTCNDAGVFAYVYPSMPYKIYLCPAYWTAGTTGTDSKGGTLVHETSHFTVVAGTQDYAYGQPAAKALAKSNPAKAVMNADSHEYFVENRPALA